MTLPDPKLAWPIAYDAVRLIAESESCKLRAYRCPAGVWTIAWGRTAGVKPGDTCTQDEADRWFLEDINEFTAGVRAALTRPATLNELGALVSLSYNIGLGGLRRSTVLRKHNEGDMQGASDAFRLWNKARVGGVLTVLPGLVTRRAREAALYLTPDNDDNTMPMAQAVLPEDNPLKHSRTIIAGSAGIGVLGADIVLPVLFGDASGQVAQLIEYLQTGDTMTKIIAVALIGFMVYARREDWIKKLR
jgi:lysozyme